MSDSDDAWAPEDMFAEGEYEEAIYEVPFLSTPDSSHRSSYEEGDVQQPYITWPAYSTRFESPG